MLFCFCLVFWLFMLPLVWMICLQRIERRGWRVWPQDVFPLSLSLSPSPILQSIIVIVIVIIVICISYSFFSLCLSGPGDAELFIHTGAHVWWRSAPPAFNCFKCSVTICNLKEGGGAGIAVGRPLPCRPPQWHPMRPWGGEHFPPLNGSAESSHCGPAGFISLYITGAPISGMGRGGGGGERKFCNPTDLKTCMEIDCNWEWLRLSPLASTWFHLLLDRARGGDGWGGGREGGRVGGKKEGDGEKERGFEIDFLWSV